MEKRSRRQALVRRFSGISLAGAKTLPAANWARRVFLAIFLQSVYRLGGYAKLLSCLPDAGASLHKRQGLRSPSDRTMMGVMVLHGRIIGVLSTNYATLNTP
jgi:hypothetical protein